MTLTFYICCKCKTVWRYLPKREWFSGKDNLCGGQCDCGYFINIKCCNLQTEKELKLNSIIDKLK